MDENLPSIVFCVKVSDEAESSSKIGSIAKANELHVCPCANGSRNRINLDQVVEGETCDLREVGPDVIAR